jgi:predicted nucleic acid-binding protein
VIYLDSSVALAHIFGETRTPSASLWQGSVASSRLLEYEIWNRLHARQLGDSHRTQARELIERVVLVELTPGVLARALGPFPVPVRTLDALHLASLHYLLDQGQKVALASYDRRLLAAARALGIETIEV